MAIPKLDFPPGFERLQGECTPELVQDRFALRRYEKFIEDHLVGHDNYFPAKLSVLILQRKFDKVDSMLNQWFASGGTKSLFEVANAATACLGCLNIEHARKLLDLLLETGPDGFTSPDPDFYLGTIVKIASYTFPHLALVDGGRVHPQLKSVIDQSPALSNDIFYFNDLDASPADFVSVVNWVYQELRREKSIVDQIDRIVEDGDFDLGIFVVPVKDDWTDLAQRANQMLYDKGFPEELCIDIYRLSKDEEVPNSSEIEPIPDDLIKQGLEILARAGLKD